MEVFLIICIVIIAFLYSSVGHGGASGYLALMAFFSIAPEYMKSSALLMNLFVSAIAFFSYYQSGYFRWKIFLPFAISSMPMAFFGAKLIIDPQIYKFILGILLLIGAGRILYKPKEMYEIKKSSFLLSLAIGAVMGFFSGMIGIGGGIILSPLLLMLKWTNVKETAAISALFIFVNSATGLAGTWKDGFVLPNEIILWITAGIIGGLAGSYMGSKKFSFVWTKYILAVVLIMASIKLFSI
ncbi:MAG: sulfite exporter TauE/SafE family protein [Bacteroidetes bacterium]|nr:sulfite exporter TauE/SafE family protein [Bacteroidota bacterium]